MFQIEAHRPKGDDSIITKEEADNFNKDLPEFFGDDYETKIGLKLRKSFIVGFSGSGVFLLLTIRTY